jgi:hypothetical protein
MEYLNEGFKMSSLASILANLPPKERLALLDMMKNKELAEGRDRFDLNKILFDKQLQVVEGAQEKNVVVCSRRGGKSYFIATLMIHLCLTYPERFKTDKNGNPVKNVVVPENYVVYIGLNKSSARRVIWGTLMQLIRTYNVDCKPNEHELTISFPQQHIKIIVEGAKDAATIERLRGIHAIAAFVDEAQSLPIGLATDLVQSVVLPFLTDYDGKLYLLGTPDPLGLSVLRMAWDGTKSGWFGYSKFHWCVTDNIMFPRFLQGKSTPETYLQEVMEKSGFTVDSPQFIREYLGKFADDTDSLVYGFDYNRDTLLQLPPHIHNWVYIISGDVGFSDSDAIIVIAFSYSYPTAFIVDEFSKSGLSADEFVLIYKEFCDKYNPIRSVIDYGGGGLKIIETINQRYGINVKPCKKWSPKTIGAAVLSSEFRSQRLKVLTSCDTTISQLESITWQTKVDRNGAMTRYIPDGKQVRDAHGAIISDDCADSLLYGLSELRNYLAVEDEFLTPEQQQRKQLEEHRKKIVMDYNNELEGKNRESFY